MRFSKLAAIPLVAVVTVVAMFAFMRLAAAPDVAARGAPVAVLTPAPAPTALPTSTPESTKTELVAIVNGVAITLAQAVEAQTIDQVMSTLTGRTPASPQRTLEELINAALVRQAASADALKAAATADASASLQQLLASLQIAPSDLATALRARKVTDASLGVYFAQLLQVDQLARAEALAQAVSVDDYIKQLQRRARISYGPGANELLSGSESIPSAAPALAESVATAQPAAAVPAATTLAMTPPASALPIAVQTFGIESGQYAPRFSLSSLNSPTPTLGVQDFAGRPLVLSFWTTWCPYCLRQTPVLVDGAARYAADGIQFAGVNVQENAATVGPYITQHAIPYPIVLDPDGAVAAQYAVTGYPTTYFIAADGRIHARHIGALTADQLADYVEQLLHTSS